VLESIEIDEEDSESLARPGGAEDGFQQVDEVKPIRESRERIVWVHWISFYREWCDEFNDFRAN